MRFTRSQCQQQSICPFPAFDSSGRRLILVVIGDLEAEDLNPAWISTVAQGGAFLALGLDHAL